VRNLDRDPGVVESPQNGTHPDHWDGRLLAGDPDGRCVNGTSGGSEAEKFLERGMTELRGKRPGGRNRRHGLPFVESQLARGALCDVVYACRSE
jgi:hypothetical protein